MKEILIRLEDELYEQCKTTELTEKNEGFDFHIIKSVANGTVLPKGHGDLIDGEQRMTDEERKKIIERIDFEEKWLFHVCEKEYRVNTNDIEIAMNGIRAVVIEADKEKKECEYYDSEAETCRRSETEFDELNNLYYGMTDSMQKAVKDIMLVANGKEIEE